MPVLPTASFSRLTKLIEPAFTIALLGGIESLLSAVVADGMIGSRHRSNMELVAQGAANIGSALFGGIPATGAIARTATNVKAGAQTPVAGMIHAATLFCIILAFAPIVSQIPLAALSAVLIMIAWNMSEISHFRHLFNAPSADIAILLCTFLLTVLVDLTVAVEVGIVLAALLYIFQVSETTSVSPVTQEYIQDGKPHILQDKQIPSYVTILRIHGPFLFGATGKLEEATHNLDGFASVVIVRLRNMTALDATGLHALEALVKRLKESGRTMLVCGMRRQPGKLIRQSHLFHEIGADNILPHVEAALKRASEIHAGFDGVGQHIADEFAQKGS
jgi:sulfate permease, SulP family